MQQELAALLQRLKAQGSRALIFTQMTRMLDVLEAFLNLNGHSYCRLDGSTKPEQRQVSMSHFVKIKEYITESMAYANLKGPTWPVGIKKLF